MENGLERSGSKWAGERVFAGILGSIGQWRAMEALWPRRLMIAECDCDAEPSWHRLTAHRLRNGLPPGSSGFVGHVSRRAAPPLLPSGGGSGRFLEAFCAIRPLVAGRS